MTHHPQEETASRSRWPWGQEPDKTWNLGTYIERIYGPYHWTGTETWWLKQCAKGFRQALAAAMRRGESKISLGPVGYLKLCVSEDPQRRRRRAPIYYEWRPSLRLRTSLGLSSPEERLPMAKKSWLDVHVLTEAMDDLSNAIIDRMAGSTDENSGSGIGIDDLIEIQAETEDELREGVLDRARLMINWITRADALKREQEELKQREIRIRESAKLMREYLLKVFQTYDWTRVKDDSLTVSLAKLPPAVFVEYLEIPEVVRGDIRIQTDDGQTIHIPIETKNTIAALRGIDPKYLAAQITLRPARKKIKDALQQGEDVPGTDLITGQQTIRVRR